MKFTTILVYKFNKLLNLFLKVNILDTEESIDLLLNNNFSISRYGDGELNIMMGGEIHFQPFNKELAIRLKEILTKYDDKSLLKIGVPLAINNTLGYHKIAKEFWKMNMNTGRMYWFYFCGTRKIFVNASLTRCYIDYEEKEKSLTWFTKIKILWADKKVLVVEGDSAKLGFNNNLFANTISVSRIVTKSFDAWSVYEEILKATLEVARDYDLILVSLGPTATVLATDVSQKGYRILDIGHINLEYNKFLQNQFLHEKKHDINYEFQIIKRIF